MEPSSDQRPKRGPDEAGLEASGREVRPRGEEVSVSDEEFDDESAHANVCENLPEVMSAEAEATGEDHSDEEEKEILRPARSRREQKALDREIPWREIMRLDAEKISQYREAVKKEYRSWVEWSSAKEVTEERARRILSDRSMAKRVLRSRICYRDKNVGVPPLAAKARCVVIGCSDPDLAELDRNSPTPSRHSFMVVLQVYAAGKSKGKGRWRLLCADARAAFLQGAQEERPDRLYMLPPRDGVSAPTRCWPGVLYEITGNVFGLANAPLTWAKEVIRRMVEKLGFVQHSVDAMMFLKYRNGQIIVVCIFHVDDLLLTCDATYDLSELNATFSWGSMTFAPEVLTFCGRQIIDMPDKVIVCQPVYIEGTEARQVSSHRKKGSQSLTSEENTEFDSCGGVLSWVAGISRPEVAAGTSLAKSGDRKLQDLEKFYELVKYVRQDPRGGVCIRPLPLDPADTIMVSYADSSFANAPGGKSQAGILVTLCQRQALTGEGLASVLDWQSGRIRRVVRSTLAAEACAADVGIDHAQFFNAILTEIIGKGTAIKCDCAFEQYHVTDCKSLYDAVQKNASDMTEKRTLLDVKGIRQGIMPRRFRWVPTDKQWADGLTKDQKALREQFARWLNDPTVQLAETDYH